MNQETSEIVVSDQLKSMSLVNEHLVLMFAYHFPPENTIGGVRPFRFSKYLRRLGYQCHVYTASDQAGRSDSNTEHVPDPFVERPRPGIGWQFERAFRKGFFPGALGTRWSYRVRQSARTCMRLNPRARVTIFSTFPPLGPHFAAWQLGRSERLRWIADFRDPFPDGVMSEGLNVFQKWLYRWLEYILARRADAVIVNTDAAKMRLQHKFPSLGNRIHVIWNGFDPEDDLRPLPIPAKNYKVLSHVGELYVGRSATPILESIARLIAKGQLSCHSVRVRLIGSVQADCIPRPEFVQHATAQGWLELEPNQIPQSEARQITQTSDGLLLLQPQSAVQVPGKLFEYLQIGRPILAFIQRNSPTERLLSQSGVPYRCVYPGSSSETIDATVAEFFDLSPAAVVPSSEFLEQFNVERQTETLDSLIRSLYLRNGLRSGIM